MLEITRVVFLIKIVDQARKRERGRYIYIYIVQRGKKEDNINISPIFLSTKVYVEKKRDDTRLNV